MRRMNVCCCTANSHSASTAPHLWDSDAFTNGCRILHWHLYTWAKGTLEQEQYEKAHIGLRTLGLLQNLFWNVQLSFKKTKATCSCNASHSYCAFKTVPTMLQMFSGGSLNIFVGGLLLLFYMYHVFQYSALVVEELYRLTDQLLGT